MELGKSITSMAAGFRAYSPASPYAGAVDVSDVFSTYVYTGDGDDRDIVNGVNLADDGGMVWIKQRDIERVNYLFDTDRGSLNTLFSDLTEPEANYIDTLTSFNNNGFLLGSSSRTNDSDGKIASWTFKKQPKFFTQAKITHTNGTDSTVDLSSLETVGMVMLKSLGEAEKWFVWHKDMTAGKLMYLNETTAETADVRLSVSGTTLTVDSSAPDDDYIIYGFAHDPSEEGFIQCGAFTSSDAGVEIELGWEPQYLLLKNSTREQDWLVIDNIRGLTSTNVSNNKLSPNLSDAEAEETKVIVTSTGFIDTGLDGGEDYIYMAIRRSDGKC